MNSYQQRVNAEHLERQAAEVKKTVKEILASLKSIEQCLYWAIDPEDHFEQWSSNLIEHVHGLLDLGHDYRAALKANPPPKEVDEDEDYFALADTWRESLASNDPRRESTVVTRPNDAASRAFLDQWKQEKPA